ncbi:MAG TPA: tetratricopeptide repeat protein, partial [Gemmatimonadales bacterium]|nr:tetratricopeptide repeat protein [Gemmatimonadales bacterium]
PDPLLVRRPACPPALASVVMKCLEKRPADRWQSAEELLHQLEAVGTPTSGSIPTSAVSAVVTSLPGAAGTAAISNPTLTPVAASGGSWRRAGYLVLGVLLAMLAAWGVMRPRTAAAPTAARRIVVLPFENQGDSSRLYFANGVTEAITAQLTNIAGLSVIPRSTAARYRGSSKSLSEIGKELGVGYVLEGTVQFEEVAGGPPRVRISPELIRVSDTSSVWAQGYDGVMTSVFSLYSDVAQKVAGSLAVTINEPERAALDARPTSNAEAYDLYLRAVDYLNRGLSVSNFRYATPMLERAVVLDPDFALAWGRLSETLALAHWLYFSRTPETMARAEAAAKKALALQPDLPEAHRAMGSFYYRLREYNKALAEFAIVRQKQPNSADLAAVVGYVYRRQGRWDEAIAEFRRRVQLDPGSNLGWNDLGETLLLARHYDEAAEILQHGISTTPDAPDCYAWLARTELVRTNQIGPAQAILKRVMALMPVGGLVSAYVPPAYVIGPDDSLRTVFLAMGAEAFGRDTSAYYEYRGDLYHVHGDQARARSQYDSARAVLERRLHELPDDYGFHQQMGRTLLALGRIPEALKEATRATELLPVAKDTYFGTTAQIDLAKALAAAGRTREAVDKLEQILASPSMLAPVDLRLDPAWEPLRKDAEFRKLAGL